MTTSAPGSAATLNLLVLRSNDIHKAAKFYETLGLQFELHSHGTGPKHFAAQTNQIVFEIYPASEKHPVSASTRIGFAVLAVDEAAHSLAACGGKILMAPEESVWGRRAVVRDLDGHSVELTQLT